MATKHLQSFGYPAATAPPNTESRPGFRSGAVAKLAGMPVATLRIWEQRYKAVHPSAAPTGHRLYSATDAQRVCLLRRLTALGHAIGSIAQLDTAQLQGIENQHVLTQARPADDPLQQLPRVMNRVLVVGPGLASRVQRIANRGHTSLALQVVAAVAAPGQAASVAPGIKADLLLWHAPSLQAQLPPELETLRIACGAAQVAVVYQFSSAAAVKLFASTGALLLREPPSDDELDKWLGATMRRLQANFNPPTPLETLKARNISARRFDDAQLATIVSQLPTLACECPRHIAELLIQLASFEAYSADCSNTHPIDAALHAYLHQVAGTARAAFEEALERVAAHEGLLLA